MGSRHSTPKNHGPCGIGIFASMDLPTFQTYWTNIETALSPADLCTTIGGSLTANNRCSVDVLEYVRASPHINDAGQLCGAVRGQLNGNVCVIDVKNTPATVASPEAKNAACEAVGGAWDGECVLGEADMAC